MRVLGFPVHVRPGFLLFMVLIVAINGDEFGIWLAISIAAFTLLHELGHAVAARRAGGAGRDLPRLPGRVRVLPRPAAAVAAAQAAIALAGPVVHIVAGVAVLPRWASTRSTPTDRGSSPAAAAVWWAGPVIGAFNLIPVLPLDGGNVVTSLLDRLLPGRARPIMVVRQRRGDGHRAHPVCGGTPVARLVVFLGFLLVLQLQSLFDERARHAESPFDVAAAALRDGDEGRARKVLVNGLRRPSQSPVLPRSLDDDAIAPARRACCPSRCRTAIHGTSTCWPTCSCERDATTRPRDYAAGSYERQPRTLIAATVARAAGALGDEETAVAWLRAAAGIGTATDGLATVIDQAPELAGVRRRADVIALRQSLSTAPR